MAAQASTNLTDSARSDSQRIDLEAVGNGDMSAEARTIESRTPIRDQLADDIAAFLARGGSINQIDPDVTADPPKKPESNYGSRAI
jgi:hypothetical protein